MMNKLNLLAILSTMITAVILALSGFVRFIHFGAPSSVVFDEVYYGDFASSYWSGNYFFDLHPPFAKLLFAFIGKIFNLDQFIVDWSTIGNSLPISVVGLRLLPMIAGLLLPLVVYAICRRLDISKTTSFLIATLICLENSLVVQSRYLLPDVIMLLFGFSSILFYLEYTKRIPAPKINWPIIFSTVFAGIALSIKWTGLTFLFLIIIMELTRLYYDSESIKIILKKTAIFSIKYIAVSAFVYTSLFAIHFSILPKSGKGDVFMSQRFQKTLIGNKESTNPDLGPINFWEKFTELNRVMFTSSSGMTATHPNSSSWYSWPLMQRTIYYWNGADLEDNTKQRYIYLLGNPFIYWLGTFSIILLTIYTIFRIGLKKSLPDDIANSKLLIFLIIGFFANLLPFAFIGRVMFLYHYETALIFSILAIAYWIDILQPKIKTYAIVVIIVIASWAFIYWSPLTYGTPLTDEQLQQRMWLPSWR